MVSYQIPCYFGGEEAKELRFSAEMFLSLGDQPERRGANGLLAGNSRAHPHWRYACDLTKLVKVLPSCEDCRGAMRLADCSDSPQTNWKSV